MLKKRLPITTLLLTILSYSAVTSAEWQGYINNKTLADTPYGYLASASTSRVFSQLKLVCFAPDEFEIFLDDRITDNAPISNVTVSVDQLPPLTFSVHPVTGSYTFTNKTPEFWHLIAQMSAGVAVSISTGAGATHDYDLSGFTKSYLDVCGWLDSANRYRKHLDRYR